MMIGHPYSTRSKFNHHGVPLETTPSNSPLLKYGPRSPQKANNSTASLGLQTVIGTTTRSPGGFSSNPTSDTFAFCAGSAVVLANVDQTGQITQRFLRARPNSTAVNPVVSFYTSFTSNGTLESRRKSVLPSRALGMTVAPTGSPRREWVDDGSSKTWTARERTKAISSVSLSIDGRFLAVGETGYNPRVLIFSTAKDPFHDLPLSIVTEHTFGVRAVAFSPDSRYLATLGEPNDGFLFIWSVDTRTAALKLHSTNKCTTNIYDMVWCGGNLITVGTRHVKVWRIEEQLVTSPSKANRFRLNGDSCGSPAPKPLSGRNCLLGRLADTTFTCATAISDREAVVCTDRGQICVLDDSHNAQELKHTKDAGFDIRSVSAKFSTGKVLFGGLAGRLEVEDIETLRGLVKSVKPTLSGPHTPVSGTSSPKTFSPHNSPSCLFSQCHYTISLGWLSRHVIAIDSNTNIRVLLDVDGKSFKPCRSHESHHDPVQGLHLLYNSQNLGGFCTWSRSGHIMFWDVDGKLRLSQHIGIDQLGREVDEYSNELRVVRASSSAEHFVSGDKLGVLKIITSTGWEVLHEVRAHSSEVTDIALQEDDCTLFIASCGKDRMVQLFEKRCETFELIQTMDDHAGAVGHVLFTAGGEKLLSCSADRTVMVRERIKRETRGTTSVAYLTSKIMTLKASPISIETVFSSPDTLVVSTMDRQIVKLSMSAGTQVDSFKVADPESDDTATLGSIAVSKMNAVGCPRLLVGFSSTDKSIRVYDYDQGVLLAREAAHTEGISDIALMEEGESESGGIKRTIFSTGLDGITIIWDLTVKPPQSVSIPSKEPSQFQMSQNGGFGGFTSRESIAYHTPLRKVLSKTDLADYSVLNPSTGSLTPVRDRSPPRVRRRTSHLSLAAGKLGVTESTCLTPIGQLTNGQIGQGVDKSPTPTLAVPNSPRRKQSSFSQDTSDCEARPGPAPKTRRSPSPLPAPISLPCTPKAPNRANNTRLRRPPSVPSDLHSQGMSKSRRKSVSVSVANEPANASIAAAAAIQQLSRNLRAYRRNIATVAVLEQTQLDEVEEELLATLLVVREKKSVKVWGRRAKATTEADLDSLATLLENTALAKEDLEGDTREESCGGDEGG